MNFPESIQFQWGPRKSFGGKTIVATMYAIKEFPDAIKAEAIKGMIVVLGREKVFFLDTHLEIISSRMSKGWTSFHIEGDGLMLQGGKNVQRTLVEFP